MSTSIKCKMKCHVAPVGDQITDCVQTVRLGAVYEPDLGQRELPENAVFGNATPWGEFVAGIGPAASKQLFQPGKSYYITISEAPD